MMSTWLARMLTVLACAGALVTPAAPGRADIITPGNAPSVRVLSYNVCGAYSTCQYPGSFSTWLNTVETQVTTWNADALMLQELCIEQWNQLRTRLAARGYVGIWAATVADATGCAKWGNSDRRFGIGTFVRASTIDRFTANLAVPAGQEARAMLCARGPVDGRTTLVCNTHLAQYITPDNGMSQVLGYADGWAAGLPIILGGDINERPDSTALRVARAGLPGTGTFAEVDETDQDQFTEACKAAQANACASGEATTGSLGKFDHILVTTRDFRTIKAAVTDPGISDHRLLAGAAYPEPKNPSHVPGDLTGDGRPDLLATHETGTLRLYGGLGNGGLSTWRQIGGSGWADAVVGHRGDWTGDGWEDLVVMLGDELWVYPNDRNGGLGTRIPMAGHPAGWDYIDHLAFPGDLTGDGTPDVIAQSPYSGLWWLWRGDPQQLPGLQSSPTQLGGAELAMADLLPAGDTDSDGRAELWARDRTTGRLTLRLSTGDGTLAAPSAVTGGTWSAATHPLIATGGDVTGDGNPDLWATTATGDLVFHRSASRSALAGPTTIGSGGWPAIRSLS